MPLRDHLEPSASWDLQTFLEQNFRILVSKITPMKTQTYFLKEIYQQGHWILNLERFVEESYAYSD